MITLNEFINKYNNQYVEEVDSSSPYQCFDLILRFCKEINLQTNLFPYIAASDIYDKFGPTQAQYFTRIYNGPNDIPKEGDIIVWNGYFNGYWYNGKYYLGRGHVGVVKSASLYSLEVFEQNDPTGTPSHVKAYDYRNISGWLRPKNYTSLTKEQQMLAIVNTPIADHEFRNKFREVYGV